MTKRDVVLSLVVGFLVAVLGLIIVANLNIKPPINKYLALVVFPPLAAAGLYILYRISLVWRPFVFQFGKFFIVGGLNTFLDLGLLNLLILLTSITQGVWFSVFKALSFV